MLDIREDFWDSSTEKVVGSFEYSIHPRTEFEAV